jgi:hypothetical protein
MLTDALEENEEGEHEMTGDVSGSSTTPNEISDAFINPVLLGETGRTFSQAFDASDLSLPIDDSESHDSHPEILARIA